MSWKIKFDTDAKKEYSKLDGSMKKQVLAGIIKVSKAPLPSPHDYGKPLGNKNGNDLTGFFKAMSWQQKHIKNMEIRFSKIYLKILH